MSNPQAFTFPLLVPIINIGFKNMADINNTTKAEIKCADCGKELAEIPFPIYCKECWAKRKAKGQDRMFQGSWKCAKCRAKITALPFQPTEGRLVYCNTCWEKIRKEKG